MIVIYELEKPNKVIIKIFSSEHENSSLLHSPITKILLKYLKIRPLTSRRGPFEVPHRTVEN